MKTGIWIDKKVAHIVKTGPSEEFISITAEDVSFDYKDIERKGGASEVIRDRRLLERKKHAETQYFSSIIPALSDTQEMIIMGPAQAGPNFLKFLKSDHPALKSCVKDVIKSHKMTENQLKAFVRSYFS